ncbi:MAG TPA: U32 family peptidase [Sedimenticola sp.]|nr:U32 family peptidase [Sedimenticola sp.]
MVRKKVELLAPAGSWEALEAVIEAGADAVYFSEKRFGMRQHGAWLNFGDKEIADVIACAHERGARAYLTLNNLLTGDEIGSLEKDLLALSKNPPDALIVQDLGLLQLLRQLDLGIPLHASTMMNIHHARAAGFLKRHGVSRIITSRDISLDDARELGRISGLEVEYFLHGDMCIAVGSQCLHSGVSTGMSANRGKCLKSCRWAWSLMDREGGKVLASVDEQYLLALKDICLYHQLPQMIAGGIASLKIEGRARPGDYLAPIVGAYREAIDRYYANPAAYATDFGVLRDLRGRTIREIGTSHALSQPGVGAVGLSGKREPRFFSIAIEEKPCAEEYLPATAAAAGWADRPELSVRCGDMRAARAVLAAGADHIYVGGESFQAARRNDWRREEMAGFIRQCRDEGVKVGVVTPRITTDREFFELESLLETLEQARPDSYLVSNIGALEWMNAHTDTPLHGDFSLNVWNARAVELLQQSGVASVTAGLELDLAQAQALASQSPLPVECLVHGALPGMLLEYCPIGVHMSGTTRQDPCPGPCKQRAYALRSRAGQLHWLETDQYCRNHLFMAKDLCMIGHLDRLQHPNIERLRIEGALYETDYLCKLVRLYQQAIGSVYAGGEIQGLQPEVELGAPRPLTVGAYGNTLEGISEPCKELPTDLLIQYG